ncbi:hypothetical protein Mapa_007845 [Marchantia paleacea]|nr:hypothetical protein Mapa_007845 [Marchantia paleacea]
MADGSGNDMDFLFEGMDFVMTGALEDASDPPADGLENDSKHILKEKSGQNGSAAVPPTLVPALTSALPATRSSSSSSLTSLPFLARNISGSLVPGGQLSPPAHGGLQRDPSKPLDETLFSGLNVSFMDDEGSMQLHFAISESQTDGVSQTSVGTAHHRRTDSYDGKSAAEKAGNAERERPTVESIMTAYINVGPTSSFKHSSSGNALTSKAASSLTPSPSQKPGMRRKKRSMKIGYGREEEEQDDLSLRKNTIRDKITRAAAGKEIVNGIFDSSPRHSVSSHGLSRASSQGQLDVDEFSEGTSVAEEIESSLGETALAERADGEVDSSSKALESQSNCSDIVLKSATAASLDEDKLQPKAVESEDINRINDTQEALPSAVHEMGKDQEAPGSVLPNLTTVYGEETVVKKSSDNIPPEETVSEADRGDSDASSLTVQTAVREVKGVEGGENPSSSEDDLDITSLAAKKTGTIEERLQYVQELVAREMTVLQGRNSVVSALRKAAVQERRQAAERASAASTRCKNLEAELNAACENEDFEKADALSESVAEAENGMHQAAEDFKLAEAKCDSAASKVQEILDLQVATEEEGARIFELLKQEAEDAAERVRTEAQETARREMERLSADEEAAEARRRKLTLSLRIIEEANAELDKVIGEGTKEETELKTSLTEQRSQLLSELEELLALVRKKEAEIADYDQRIQAVDEKMSSVVANFETQRSSLDAESKALAVSSLELDDEFKRIAAEKQGVDELLAEGEKEGLKLEKAARSASDAGCAVQEALKLKKAIATTTFFYKEKRSELAEKEKKALEEAQALRHESLSGRSSLQELTSMKMKLNQEIGEKKQLMLFVEKRTPELDSEKKLAAAARNFKEAGRLAAEAKALTAEKEAATADITRMLSELQNVETEADLKLGVLDDMDRLISEKEKAAAISRCERLRLMAAAARMERDAAIELEDFEEAESLDSEAETADLEAEELQRVYELEGGQFEKQINSLLTFIDQVNDSPLESGANQATSAVEAQVGQTDLTKIEEGATA